MVAVTIVLDSHALAPLGPTCLPNSSAAAVRLMIERSGFEILAVCKPDGSLCGVTGRHEVRGLSPSEVVPFHPVGIQSLEAALASDDGELVSFYCGLGGLPLGRVIRRECTTDAEPSLPVPTLIHPDVLLSGPDSPERRELTRALKEIGFLALPLEEAGRAAVSCEVLLRPLIVVLLDEQWRLQLMLLEHFLTQPEVRVVALSEDDEASAAALAAGVREVCRTVPGAVAEVRKLKEARPFERAG